MLRSAAPALALLLFACDGPRPEADVVSSDQRIDAAGPDDVVDSDGARMCINSQGHVYVVWFDDRDGKPAVWFNRSTDAGRSWMPAAVRVSQGTAGDATQPDIDCTDDYIVVVWEDDRDGELENHNIYLNRSTDSGDTWREQDVLIDADPDGNTMSLGPRVVAAGSEVHVAWYDSIAGAYDIYTAASTNGGAAFAEPVRVDSDGDGDAYSASPRIGADGAGHVYVVWEDSRDGLSDIYFSASSNSGASYATDTRLDGGDAAGSSNSFSPRLAVEDGLVAVVWHDARNGEGRDIFLNRSTDHGANWLHEAVRVETDNVGFFDSIYPDVAIHQGVVHVVWQDARNEGYDIYYRQAVGGDFGEDEEVRLDTDAPGFGNSVRAQIVAGEAGVVAVWEDLRDDSGGFGYNELYYNYSQDGGLTWSDEDLRLDNIEPGTSYATDVALGLHRGELMGAWIDGRRGNADVYFHHLKVGEEAEYVPAE